jgi:predicted RNA polymerase sigma factor
MELQGSRGAARIDADGNLVLLEDQDRRRWDRAWIARGLAHLERARATGTPGPYRVQAEIAACHAIAPGWAETDWRRIAALYTELVRLVPSPVVELNRAVAISMVDGPAAGLAIVDALRDAPRLRDYHLLPATRADLLRRLGAWAEARNEYARALSLAQNRREQEFLARRVAECAAHLAPSS